MTRTERNSYPAAQMKDRHSRTGIAHKNEFERKGGAGAHNWGSFNEEENLAYQGDMDARLESAMFPEDEDESADTKASDSTGKSPADSMASLESRGAPGKSGGRRMSQVTDEERAEAIRYREGGLKQKGVDLASIARTSHAATSPTTESVLATSPLRTKAGFSMQQ